VAEYALLTSTMAAVVVLVAGTLGGTLPRTTQQASTAIAAAARKAGVPAAEAQKAMRRAPYARPSLRTLYGLGWVSGRKDPLSCKLATALGSDTIDLARAALRDVPGRARLLRRAGITEKQALTAMDRGFRTSCA